jgi:hypothetical protein
MMGKRVTARWRRLGLVASVAALGGPASILALPGAAFAANHTGFAAGDLLVTTGMWTTDADIDPGVTQLPPGCGVPYNSTVDAKCGTAVAPGTFPLVFNNAGPDGSFGVTEPIVLEEVNPTTDGVIKEVTVPDDPANGDYMTTSYSSKSELALNQSTDGQWDTFVGYVAPPATIDASNANTPGEIDPTIKDSATPTYRVVAQVNAAGRFGFTETNAFSGDNGRAAVLDPEDGPDGTIFAAGNAGNGANPEPAAVIDGAGSQILTPADEPESAQNPGAPTPYGNFNITELNPPADKSGKDNNYRGIAVYDGVVYLTKGSGGNGVDTVYFVDPNGSSTNSGGVGLPSSTPTLPDAASWTAPTYSTNTPPLGLTGKNPGLTPTNTYILKGFNTALATDASDQTGYPFGLWFANPTTLYVADEGPGDTAYDATTNTFTGAASSPQAGLQKWSFNSTAGQWQLDYVLQNGLDLGTPYNVLPGPNGQKYPVGLNNTDSGTGLPWSPATAGLRGLAGRVNPDGTVSLWATTSTVSGSGDIGADPNKLVAITDRLAATTASQASHEKFTTVLQPSDDVVVRGVAMTPGSPLTNGNDTNAPVLAQVSPGMLPGREST